MATFKVGQRVKVACSTERNPLPHCVGKTGTIVEVWAACEYPYRVNLDNYYRGLWFYTHELAPLTDPDSEWADEAVKKLLVRAKECPVPLDAEIKIVAELGRCISTRDDGVWEIDAKGMRRISK